MMPVPENQKVTIRTSPGNVTEGERVDVFITAPSSDSLDIKVYCEGASDASDDSLAFEWTGDASKVVEGLPVDTAGFVAGVYDVQCTVLSGSAKGNMLRTKFRVWAKQEISRDVMLHRSGSDLTLDLGLWAAIRNRTEAVGFKNYQEFIDRAIATGTPALTRAFTKSTSLPSVDRLAVQGPYAYTLLKLATQVFLTLEAGVVIEPKDPWTQENLNENGEALRFEGRTMTSDQMTDLLKSYMGTTPGADGLLPYLGHIAKDWTEKADEFLPNHFEYRLHKPSMIELIWSYWHEEGMLAQTMNAIAYRFQNRRSGPSDPLGELEIDPLRPLNNMIWGFVQDEHNRLSVRRRAFEYDHHYGLKLVGRAIPELQSADSRSKFIETFHNLLYRTAVFYREDADTTVISDAFPLLNALKDVHLLLAEGAHNQYGDLPWTARAEMLTQQWMLARPEMREFLRGRHMVPYQEHWMGAVDAMKKLQGWGDTTITHFNELAVDGERLLLSIRFGDWSELHITEDYAKNWARYWKPEIQRYLYGYLAVTGVDLMADITDNREAATRNLQPSALLQRRLAAQTRQSALPAPRATGGYRVGTSGYSELPRGVPMRALNYEEGE